MSFIVSARKYRPQSFEEVIGQRHISSTLKQAIKTDQLAHAFLFCGPRGVGKTTCARILAKVINCENQTDQIKPCNNCSSCLSFNDNASFNIIELDAASNNSVDHIRTLIEQVRFQPQHGKYKVFIIDEVHMLSTSAFNAFLKTLEEPPPYAVFILATTEKHKIIPTILSRCQIFDFKRIQLEDIVQQLEHIIKSENRTADLEALHIIAQKADGSMRDALSIYDRIATTSADHISYKDVIANLNILDFDYYFKVLDAILREDISSVLLQYNEILSNGFDGDLFINGFANHLRNLLVCKDPATLQLLEVSQNLQERYQAQASQIPLSGLMTALDISNQCDIHYGRAVNKRLHIEIALSKMVFMNRLVPEDQVGVLPKRVSEKKTEIKSIETIPSSSVTDDDEQAESILDTIAQLSNEIVEKEVIELEEVESTITNEKVETTLVNTPKLSSLESLTAQIKIQDKITDAKPTKVALDIINNIWKEHLTIVEAPTVRNVLKESEIECHDNGMKVYVSSKVSKDILLQESILFEKIRDHFNIEEILFEVIIDRDRFPDKEEIKPIKLLTNKEKYDKLKEINPLISDLKDRFGLKIDNE